MPGAHSNISQGLNYAEQPNKHYISTRAFSSTNTTGTIFTYTTSLNNSFQTVGTLTANANATAANCPVGRVVHSNGKRLYPNVHPNITKVWVGVFDPISFLNGYIDPTDSTWAVYDTTLGSTYDLGATGSTTQDTVLGGQGAESRFGRVVNVTATGTTTTGAANIGSGKTGVITVGAVAFTAANGITVTATEVKADSVILLTMGANVSTAITLRVNSVAAGSFIIVPSAAFAGNSTETIHYLIVN